jgi:hypothetical protein
MQFIGQRREDADFQMTPVEPGLPILGLLDQVLPLSVREIELEIAGQQPFFF